MPDHEVHEIQLNGKQLVFMFMAATVVAVVIFLSGVMVGRGVRLPQADVLAASADPVVDPTASLDTAPSGTALTTDPAPAPAPDSLSYAEHLEAPVAPNEPLKPAEPRQPEPKPVIAPAANNKAAASKVAAPRETKDANRSFAEPPGNGWVAQVQTFGSLPDAEALAGRLKAQGYRTFVTLNESGPPSARYRVRIGKYPTRAEAVAVGEKLQREERFKPWVTR
jgi:septal ring-binding cell division protein DamX